MLLAARFGGTPWQWRTMSDERDWGTALELLQLEQEQLMEATDGE